MLSLYLFSLVLGGGFLAFSLLGDLGDHADVGFHSDAGGDLGHGAAEHDGGTSSRVFSLRAATYALFGFGGVGLALERLTPGLHPTVRLGFALAGGALAGALVVLLFGWLKATESGALLGDAGFVGLAARVTVPLSGGAPGAITVERGARRYTLRALPQGDAGADTATWSSVVVVEMRDGIARVTPLEKDLALEP